MGLTALYLDTSSGLREAIVFYQSLGFKDAPFDPSSVQDPEIAHPPVIMEKAQWTGSVSGLAAIQTDLSAHGSTPAIR